MDDRMDEIEEEQVRGLELQSAILHVLDGRRHRISLSEQTLDLEQPPIEKYVKRYVNRCRKDMRCAPAHFAKDSAFDTLLGRYFRREISLADFSADAVQPLISYFEHEEARSFEVLFADYRVDDVPYLAVILLEEQDTLACMTSAENGRILNTIAFGNTSLPAVSKPVSSFAVINILTGDIDCVDVTKWNDGTFVMMDVFLDAKAGLSRKEVVENVKVITCEVAEEFHENPTLLLSKVKNYISDTAKEGMPLRTETLVSELFEEQPEIKERFLEKAAEKTLPPEVDLPRTALAASMKKQKIKTDTGIEITFPAEYFRNQEFIEFVNHSDGTITIEIKQISKITNRM